MATVDYTVNSDSTSPDPLLVDPGDEVNIRAGTNPPSRITITPSGLFPTDVVLVPSTQPVRAQSGEFEVWNNEASVQPEGGEELGPIKIGNIRVKPPGLVAA